MIKWQHKLAVMVSVTLLSGPILASEEDPFEGFNRVMYNFNELVDKIVLKPVANFYNAVVPKPVVKCFTNVYANIDNVPTVLNDVLQANFYQAASDAWRLGINTTIGIGGLFDPASAMGLEQNYEDLGLTFARWGWTNSTYLVLPFLGPSSIRDGLAWLPNYEYLTIYPHVYPDDLRYGLFGFGIVVRRADLLSFQEVLQEVSVDRYVFLRDAYFQHRNYLIERNTQLGNPYLNKDVLSETTTTDADNPVDTDVEAQAVAATTNKLTQEPVKQ